MSFNASLDLDANGKPIYRGEFPFRTKRTITFLGETTDAWGNDGGALDDSAIFTVTGVVMVKLIADIKTSLTGASATIEVGITGDTAIFMPTETGTQLDAGQIWFNDAGNATYGIVGEEAAAADNLPEYILNGNDIILTVKTANVATGKIDFYALWNPISDDGSITPTTT
jgi:hypothetical protein